MTGTSSDGAATLSSACAVCVGEKRKRNQYGDSCNDRNHGPVSNNRRGSNDGSSNTGNRGVVHTNRRGSNDDGDTERGEESVQIQPKISESVGPKFNDFSKLRGEVNFAVGQTWALYDTADGMPRLYAQIRKVSAPSFGLRITFLEPDPDDEKELQWFEEDLPISVGKFRLGQSQNTKDRSRFSHLIQCNEGSNTGRLTVFPRKGETWALFKNWDIKWSSEPDSHRKFEYEFVEILSDYTDGAGVSVVFLHKAKGFASVFFRMGTGYEDMFRILPHSLYRFSHRIPSFKLTGIEGKGVPKDAYELDQAVLPETIKEIIVPFYLLPVPTALKSKPEALCFANKGKVFKTGQIWSYYRCYKHYPRYYGRIEKITLTHAFEQDAVFTLHLSRLKATPFPEDVVKWDDKRMPVGCGTFSVMKGIQILTPYEVSHQIVPQTSMDGKEYTILPKIGDLWAIYNCWSPHFDVHGLEKWYDYDVVEVLDDTLDYKVLELEPVSVSNEDAEKTFFRAAESSHCEVIFTIPKSKRLEFSHHLPASRVTKVIDGDMQELFEVDTRAINLMIFSSYLRSQGLFPRKKRKDVRV